jgi:hypothetical protein
MIKSSGCWERWIVWARGRLQIFSTLRNHEDVFGDYLNISRSKVTQLSYHAYLKVSNISNRLIITDQTSSQSFQC